MSTPALEAEHLLRAVVGKVITNNISVQVHVGEILAVTGPSGSGKSSFLRRRISFPEPWPRTSPTGRVSAGKVLPQNKLLLSFSASVCLGMRTET